MGTDKGDHHSAGPCGCEGSAQIVKASSRGQILVWKLAFRPPLVALIMTLCCTGQSRAPNIDSYVPKI